MRLEAGGWRLSRSSESKRDNEKDHDKKTIMFSEKEMLYELSRR